MIRVRLPTKNVNFFNWGILSLLGWDQNIFLSIKKYRDVSEIFVLLTYIYGKELKLINLIPSHPIMCHCQP